MTDFSMDIVCKTERDTRMLAEKLAGIANCGDVFALYGTLGVGKSTFSRYFIQHLCGKCDVPSPTFTLVQTYEAPHFDIYHYDLYRLKTAEEVFELGIEEAFYQGVSLVEWPEKAFEFLPRHLWKITITSKENERIFTISTVDSERTKRLKELFGA